MRLIFIRHCEPDYSIDSLTNKGWIEAKCLAERVKNWNNITHYYVSPLGRAQDTCNESLKPLGKSATTLEWLKEFDVPTYNPDTKITTIPWDFYPKYWTNDIKFLNKDTCFDADIYKNVTTIKERADYVIKSFDDLLKKYGYIRKDNLYISSATNSDSENKETTLVFFCHLGVSFLIMSHLLNIAPTVMWQSFFAPPSSVTILASEEREKGYSSFRIQTFGDTSHLRIKGEPVSASGYFTNTFSD